VQQLQPISTLRRPARTPRQRTGWSSTMKASRPGPPSLAEGGLIVDLFAGPGGWSTGLRALGLADIGIEWDAAACATRVAEGHLTIQGDVSTVPIEPFRGKVNTLIASPPCQAWSLAGKQQGRPTAFLDALAGRYNAEYRQQLHADIAAQQARRQEWNEAWRAAADAHGWWAPAEQPLPNPPQNDRLQTRLRGRSALSNQGMAAMEREFGPEPDVEDERGIYMAELVRWIDELDHEPNVVGEQVPLAHSVVVVAVAA
jgi:hypothetical protein